MTIELREKPLADGNKSLYLDIYHEGLRTQEFLGLYLVPEVNAQTKKLNANAMRRALIVRFERLLHPDTIRLPGVKGGERSVLVEARIRTLAQWLDRYEELMDESEVSPSIMKQVRRMNEIVRAYLSHIRRPAMQLHSIDREFIRGFLSWLRRDYRSGRSTVNPQPLSDASLHQYQVRLNCILNRAVREGLLKSNPFYSLAKVERYKVPPVSREYLTAEELMRFLAVGTDGKATQQAFGFASFTGLRKSDIAALMWLNVTTIGGSRCLSLRMKKTREPIVIPLGRMALRYLPEKPEGALPTDLVFNLPTNTAIQTSCKWIAKRAGIDKNVSFNTSRHTYATLTLEACHDIKMVSKLLGHKSVLTTQVYAEVQMASKVKAVNNVNGNFGRRHAMPELRPTKRPTAAPTKPAAAPNEVGATADAAATPAGTPAAATKAAI